MAGENSSFTNQNTTYPAGPETHPVSPRSETFLTDISGPETHPVFPRLETFLTDISSWSWNEGDIPIDQTGPNPSYFLPDAARINQYWFTLPPDFDISDDVVGGLEPNPEFDMLFELPESEKEVGGVQRDIIELSNEVLDGKLSSLDQPSVDAFKDGPDVGIVDSNTTVANGSEGSTTRTQERKRKKKGVRFDISLENVLEFSALSRRDAALKLKVSESTLKRVCKKYGIRRWPPRGIHKEERFRIAVPSTGDIVSLDSPGDIGITRWPYQQISVLEPLQNGGGAVARGKTGVRIEIPLEDVLRYSDMKLDDAARKLKVCSATLKRICRDYGIRRWPPRN